MEQLNEFLNLLKFGHEYGDWSGALVALLLGIISFVGTSVFAIFTIFRWIKESKRQRIERLRAITAEEDENYMKYREWFERLSMDLTQHGSRIYTMNYAKYSEFREFLSEDKDIDHIRSVTFHILNLLSDIEFLYCTKQNSLYWKRWDHIFKFVFDKYLFKTAFIKHREEFLEVNSSFVKYVDNIIRPNKSTDENKKVILGGL